jgi:hypothetical protein
MKVMSTEQHKFMGKGNFVTTEILNLFLQYTKKTRNKKIKNSLMGIFCKLNTLNMYNSNLLHNNLTSPTESCWGLLNTVTCIFMITTKESKLTPTGGVAALDLLDNVVAICSAQSM